MMKPKDEPPKENRSRRKFMKPAFVLVALIAISVILIAAWNWSGEK